MARSTIPVNMRNPGQVFACLGFVEVAVELLGHSRGGFDWGVSEGSVFHLEVDEVENPVRSVLSFFDECTVKALLPIGWKQGTGNKEVASKESTSYEFPIPRPEKPAKLPACLELDRGDGTVDSVVVDHWGDDGTRRDNVKFWAGMGGFPGAALVQNALTVAKNAPQGGIIGAAAAPFECSAPQKNSLRFDWRRDYVPLDAGFSPNDHGHITMLGYPLVEILAAIGLSNARPFRYGKLEYGYGTMGTSGLHLYDPMFLRAALGCKTAPISGIPFRHFRMLLDWPGQADQARCIKSVYEEVTR